MKIRVLQATTRFRTLTCFPTRFCRKTNAYNRHQITINVVIPYYTIPRGHYCFLSFRIKQIGISSFYHFLEFSKNNIHCGNVLGQFLKIEITNFVIYIKKNSQIITDQYEPL